MLFKRDMVKVLLAAVLAARTAAGGADLEREFRAPEAQRAKPVMELALPLVGMGFEQAAVQLDRAREMGAGGVLLEVGTADEQVWELLVKLTGHARQTGMEIGLRDFFVSPDEALAVPRLRRLAWAAYPVQGPAELGTNAFPAVFRNDDALRLLACVAVPEENGDARPLQPVDISQGGQIGEGRWRLIRFGTLELEPPATDFFEGATLARHVNRWLSECQSRLSRGYGRTVRWYQMSMPGRHELIWTEGLPGEFLKRSGLGLERHLPALAGCKVGGEAVAEHVRRQAAEALRALWRERVGKKVDDLVYAAGLEAGISIEQTLLDPEETAMYFRQPLIAFARDTAGAQANQRASGGARAMGRRLVTGRLEPAAVAPALAAEILPFPWKHAVDRLLEQGATRVLLDTGGVVPQDATLFGQMQAMCGYLHRCQTLLQKGEAAADWLVWAEAPPAALAGYACDYANAEMLEAGFVRDGRVCFESERAYSALAVTAPVLRRAGGEKLVRRLAAGGVKVWLVPTGESDEGEVFAVFAHGEGADAIKIFQAGAAGLPLEDFRWRSEAKEMVLRFLHRRTEWHELYFVVNAGEAAGPVECVFRDTGKGVPARWDPVDGAVGLLDNNAARLPDGSVRARFFMEPYDACFIVFER